MMKAIRISKGHMDTIVAETGIRKESLEVLATSGDVYLVIGPEVMQGQQTYHNSIFKEKFRYVTHIDPRKFNEVVFT